MDGVLIDSIPFAMQYFIERHPGINEKEYKEIHAGNFHENAKKFLHLAKNLTEEEKKVRQQRYGEIKAKTPLFNGIKELLEKLHKSGYIIVLNTNAYNRNTLPILEHSKINDLFDFIATAELSKDKTEKFKIIEEKYNTDKKNILFVTDALGDVKEANLANISTIAVTWGAHDKSFFEREYLSNLVMVVDTVKELEDFILSN